MTSTATLSAILDDMIDVISSSVDGMKRLTPH